MCQLSGSSGQDLIDAIEPYNLMWPTGHIGSVGVAGKRQNKPASTELVNDKAHTVAYSSA